MRIRGAPQPHCAAQAKMHGGGTVKTNTKRYPIKHLIDHCGPNPGDWCVMTTTLESGHLIYALGHRRGGEVGCRRSRATLCVLC